MPVPLKSVIMRFYSIICTICTICSLYDHICFQTYMLSACRGSYIVSLLYFIQPFFFLHVCHCLSVAAYVCFIIVLHENSGQANHKQAGRPNLTFTQERDYMSLLNLQGALSLYMLLFHTCVICQHSQHHML